MAKDKAFTGQTRRRRTTRWSVRFWDKASQIIITICGLGTIVVVSTMMIFLIIQAAALFFPADVDEHGSIPAPIIAGSTPVEMDVDEDQILGWTLFDNGQLATFDLTNGKTLQGPVSLFADQQAKATCRSLPISRQEQQAGKKVRSKEMAFGFDDGTVRIVRFRYHTIYRSESTEAEMREHFESERFQTDGGESVVISYLPKDFGEGLSGWRALTVQVEKPLKSRAARAPVVNVDYSISPTRNAGVTTLRDDGKLTYNKITKKTNLLTGQTTLKLAKTVEIPYQADANKGELSQIILMPTLQHILVIWKNADYQRFNISNASSIYLAESGTFKQEDNTTVTAITALTGKNTIILGTSKGQALSVFLANDAEAGTKDGVKMMQPQTMEYSKYEVTAITAASENRLLLLGFSDGTVQLVYVTSEKNLGNVVAQNGAAVQALALSPRNDGFLAQCGDQIQHWKMDQGHPEVSLSSLFLPVHYEGKPEAEHVWQTSGGDDSVEPKFGMWPLVFGTLKATFYSLLFGVPLALLAAIYTSEFMKPRARSVIKPAIELMAGLPSVVLGFLAAWIFAQFVESVVVSVIATFVMVPFAFLLMAQFVLLMPEKISRWMSRWRLLFLIPAFALGLLLGAWSGPLLEKLFFGGNLSHWLSSGEGFALGGWMLLFLPLSAIIVAILISRHLTPELRKRTATWSRRATAWVEVTKFIFGAISTLLLALALSALMQMLGWDARSVYLGTYSQRNALIVGFAMGFAIIPIIYTIAEDALSAVPGHLRSGSLAAGATPWQTATRIIIPTAMSGLFSAVMIGMGRAIGETMIVVMAAGGTPITDWNLFDGMRPLSAAIAIELGEAEVGGTHARVLYLAALILFSMTFVLNTFAEIVRLRFRKRAFQL